VQCFSGSAVLHFDCTASVIKRVSEQKQPYYYTPLASQHSMTVSEFMMTCHLHGWIIRTLYHFINKDNTTHCCRWLFIRCEKLQNTKDDIQQSRHGRHDIDVDWGLEPTQRTQSSRVNLHLDMRRICCLYHVHPTVPRTNDRKFSLSVQTTFQKYIISAATFHYFLYLTGLFLPAYLRLD